MWKLDFFIRREAVSVEDFIGEILFVLLKNTPALEDAFLMEVKYVSVNCFSFRLNLIGNFSTERLLIMRVF